MDPAFPQIFWRQHCTALAALALASLAACGGEQERTVVSVSIDYPSADVDAVHRGLTLPVERALAAVEEIAVLMTESRVGRSRSEIVLKAGAESGKSLAAIRDAVERVLVGLPRRAAPPDVRTIGAADRPIGYLALTSPAISRADLAQVAGRIANGEIAPALAAASRLDRSAVPRRIIRITIDSPRLAAHGMARADLEAALRGQGHAIIGADPDAIVLDAEATAPRSLDSLLVKTGPTGAPIRLQDVAVIEIAIEHVLARFNGRDAAVVRVLRKPGFDEVRSSDAVRLALHEMRNSLPSAVTVDAQMLAAPEARGVVRFASDLWEGKGDGRSLRLALILLTVAIAGIGGVVALRRLQRKYK